MPASTEILTETLWPLSDRSGTRALASIASVPPVALPVRKAFLKGVCSYFQAVVASNQPHNSTFREFFCTGQLGSIATASGQPARIGQPLASDLLTQTIPGDPPLQRGSDQGISFYDGPHKAVYAAPSAFCDFSGFAAIRSGLR